MKRRDVLKSAGLLIGFSLSGPLEALAGQTASPGGAERPRDAAQVDSFLSIATDGSVTIYTSKVDVGTGMRIAIAQMAAEELGVAVEKIAVIDGDTSLCPNSGGTGGSTGLTRGGVAVRQAAATARQALLARAATRLGRDAAALTIADGIVRPLAGGRGIAIGRLVEARSDRRLEVAVDPKAPLAPPSTYKQVGRSTPRPDVAAKTTGRYVYIQDFAVPGMRHARVVRPPAPGATLVSVDEASIRHLPAVEVVRVANFLAVVAADEWAALRAARELDARWTESSQLPGHENLERYLRDGVVDREQVFVDRGGEPGLTSAFAAAAVQRAATYFWPCQSHASIGPSCAVADVRGDAATVWTSSQVTYGLRATLARVFGLALEKTRVVFVEGSGSYGTNAADHAAADAVLISKTIGRPVRVQWSRQDEHAWDPKGPQQLIDVRGCLDATGALSGWETEMWIPTNRRGARILLAADAAGLAQDSGRDAAAIFENAEPPYAVDAVRVRAHWLRDTPLNPSNLRAPGKPANVLAVEGTIDELARESGQDPLEFRRRHLKDPRALEVLARGAAAFGWTRRGTPPSPLQDGVHVGRGVAYLRYKMNENYVATFIEAAVRPGTGQISVRRVVCAHDCGLVVNPDALQNQIEGAIVQGLSRAIHEEVQFDTSRVTSVDWATYPILTLAEAPAIEVILVERPAEPLWGAGEASTVPVAAALANAVFDAVGVRLRRVPFTAARVREALAARGRTGGA